MNLKNSNLARQQLDQKLLQYKSLVDLIIPVKGWIRAIRFALGMSGRQLAKRLNVTKQRITLLEQDELSGSTTIKMMKKVANALDCTFVYGLIPHTTLQDILKKKARKKIKSRMNRLNQTMLLENQNLPQRELTDIIEREIDAMLKNSPKDFWDD